MDPSGQRASTAWTPQEDQTLLHARAQGLNWAPIQAAHFPTKTPNACRKRHERLIEKRNVDDWGGERFEDLARHYMEARRDMWSLLGARVGEKWQIVESKLRAEALYARNASPLA
ncbi:MAG: hypothetical protein M1838_005723 [Thelocarpon superellum]|nr:MAG: hypothetical protein M1838_005723 [Thelocarpon superellum]